MSAIAWIGLGVFLFLAGYVVGWLEERANWRGPTRMVGR